MDSLSLSIQDLVQHSVTFGIDVYPSVDLYAERTRLHVFYEEAREKWPQLYTKLTESDAQFQISNDFRPTEPKQPAFGFEAPIFVLTPRGPVFTYPLKIAGVGDTGLEDRHLELFEEARTLFFKHMPNRAILRVGLVRELVFDCGQTAPIQVLSNLTQFGGAKMVGGMCGFAFRDEKANVRVELQSVQIEQATQLAIGPRYAESTRHGLGILLDVNNHAVQTLETADIDEIIERANSFWPGQILDFVNR